MPDKRLATRIGFWAAVLSALWTLAFALAVPLLMLLYPAREWQGIEALLATYSPVPVFGTVLPSFLLTLTFLVLMASIHALAPPDRKVLSLIGLALATIYAAVLGANYYVQLTAVRQNLLMGQGEGLALLVLDNPQSIFWALEWLGYGLMCLATLAVAPLFGGSSLGRWIRRLFILNGAIGVLSLAGPILALPQVIILGLLALWCVEFAAAMILLVRAFLPAAGPLPRRGRP